jgi:hypothetical protein
MVTVSRPVGTESLESHWVDTAIAEAFDLRP